MPMTASHFFIYDTKELNNSPISQNMSPSYILKLGAIDYSVFLTRIFFTCNLLNLSRLSFS